MRSPRILFSGGEGAPDLQETLQNLAINTTAVAVIGFFLYRDVKVRAVFGELCAGADRSRGRRDEGWHAIQAAKKRKGARACCTAGSNFLATFLKMVWSIMGRIK
eukprot:756439-Pelagomonas_calceolata.AAC.1